MLKARKYLWGGLTSPTYSLTYNQGTDLYNQLKQQGSFNNISNLFSNNILQGNNLGEFGQKLQYDMTTKSTLDSMKEMTSNNSIIGNSSTENKSNLNFNKGLQIAGMLGSTLYDQVPTADRVYNDNDKFTSDVRGTVNKTLLNSKNPYMMAAGIVNTIIDKTGGFTDASKGLGKGVDFANKVASLAIPGAGWFTGKTIDYKVSDVLKQNAASYSGTLDKANTAAQNAGAKILFGKNKANSMIASAKLADTKVNNIMEENELAMTASNNPFLGIDTQFKQMGGYQQNGVRTGKSGLKMDRDFAKKVVKLSKGQKEKRKKIQEEVRMEEVAGFQKGGTVDGITGAAPRVTFESWYKTVPSDRNDTTSYNLRRAFELAPREELEAWRTSSISDLKNGKNHLNSVYLDPKTGVYEFMKAKNHPTLKYELEWFNSDDPEAVQFRNNFNLDNSGEYYRYVPKNPEKFKNGGAVNVIPDGALHKNKHHLENVDEKFEDVTTKGIPVITESAGGDITQHAEVEREEIIFNLDVTKQLEKLMEDGSDEAAIEAGKLLVREILENTVDNTGLLNKIK